MAPAHSQENSWVLCGAGRGEVKAEGAAGGLVAVSTCLLPAPLSLNRFGQSGVQKGAGTMEVLCPGETLKDPKM